MHATQDAAARAPRRNLFRQIFILVTLAMTSVSLATENKLELAVPFTNHMILQRKAKVPVWGFDKPGSKVTVEFAGQSHSAVADGKGDWKLALDPLEASAEGRSFAVKNDRGESIQLDDVLIGEVWFASGQSNMVWLASKSNCAELAKQLSASGGSIPIREINIETVSALYPQKRATSIEGWRTSANAGSFAALALAFANELYKELQVPVGILLSAHSNTRIEAFTSRESIEAHPELKGDAELIHLGDALTPVGAKAFEQDEKDIRAWQTEAIEIAKAGGSISPPPSLPGIAGMWRGPSQFFSGKINPVVPYAIRGAIWCQGEANAGDGKLYAARMEALVRGWRQAWGMPEMPFYFTQMQCYGSSEAKPDDLGFADVRQAQFRFFLNNRKNVGMVVQTDLNSARPEGIHYSEKLHPGMRLARWALAHEYGKDIPFTGPIYSGYEVKGGKVIVSFEKESLCGGLMVGSKGLAADAKEPGKYVEPARPTPGEKLSHFRLCGSDGVWHAANARIEGDTVVVESSAVPTPTGVQYAYCAVPAGSNLYNKAGLPAMPFAAVSGELIFQPISEQRKKDETRPFVQVANYFRSGAIIQRDQPLPIWGHANAGAQVTVKLGSATATTTADQLERWSVTLPPMPASAKAITLEVSTSTGAKTTTGGILVGDVWFLTGSTQLTSEMARSSKDAAPPETLPLVREFRKLTKASTNPTPRKRYFETGGGKYRSSWLDADFSGSKEGVTMFAYQFAKTLGRSGVPQGFITMSAGSGGRSPQYATPLSWTSLEAVESIKEPVFRKRIDALMLQYPHSEIARAAVDRHLVEVRNTVKKILDVQGQKLDLAANAPLAFPPFPTAERESGVTPDMVPTGAYNWCVSPFAPMALAGVIWVPSEGNIGPEPAQYARELEIFGQSLPQTFGGKNVSFIFAQPDAALVKGITEPKLPSAKMIRFTAWPKTLKDIASQMAEAVK